MFRHPDRRRIFLMRHGEAAYIQADGTPTTDSRMVSLTELGRQQAARQAEVLRAVPFDRAVCSGLPRTVETAAIVLEGRSQPTLELVPELEEIQSSRSAMVPADPAAWIAQVANPWADAAAPEARFLGGELFSDFEARVLPAFADVLADESWHNLLLVLHGAVNRVLLNHVMHLSWQGGMSIEQDAACFNIIDVDRAGDRIERFLVRALNVTSYNLNKTGIALTDMERTAQRIAAQMGGSR